MAGTRSSARLNGNAKSSQDDAPSSSPKTGSKRKASSTDSPKDKRAGKKQQTLEETIPDAEETKATETDPTDLESKDQPTDIEMLEAAENGEGTDKVAGSTKDAVEEPADAGAQVKADESKTAEKADEKQDNEQSVTNGDKHEGTDKSEQQKETSPKTEDAPATEENKSESKPADVKPQSTTNGSGVEASSQREKAMPSSITEKGIIYFVTRGRVGIDEPESVQDLQRTFMVLRPLPQGAKITDGAIEDDKTVRLIALPKKVFPKSGRDKFMVFVEKANTSMKELKDEFFQGSEYDTNTAGTRQTPPVAPIGEGVYAMTYTNNTSHLTYMLTIPKELSEVQTDMGIREKGSFITSLKNPTVKGPSYAELPEGPGFPDEMIKDFGGRGWMPVQHSKYLNYPNVQLLLIGEDPQKFEDALEATEKDKKHDKETPLEEIEKLEQEDEIRVEHLKGMYKSTLALEFYS